MSFRPQLLVQIGFSCGYVAADSDNQMIDTRLPAAV
jgi:hypothetical protein